VGNSYPVLEQVLKAMSSTSEAPKHGSLDVVQRLVAELVMKG
jgi:hypothetical protein